MYNNNQYNDVYLRQLQDTKDKIDEILKKKNEEGKLDDVERLKLEQQRFIAPLFDLTFGCNERFRNPW